MAYKNPFLKGIYNLLVGLKVTLKYLFSRAITLQYPTERWEMPERSRGMVVLLSDKETGELNCTACMLCHRSCPTRAIVVERHRGEDKKWKLDSFTVDHTICCYCGLCEESCKFDAIKLVPKYEYSSQKKEDLIFDTKKLQEWGRDVDYTPTRRAKKATPKPAPKKAEAGEAAEVAKKPASAASEDKGKPPEKPKAASADKSDSAADEKSKPEPEDKPKAEQPKKEVQRPKDTDEEK
jgi:NADH-quinone oxidoreductase subunit I